MEPFINKRDAAEHIRIARHRAGISWAQIAEQLGVAKEWSTAALLGSHALSAQQSNLVKELLDLDDAVAEALQMQPYRGPLSEDVLTDPTIYRFQEAVMVYGPTIKELIHEEFGDGIMSAINFQLNVARRTDPEGDRVVVTFDGKFLDYKW
ncbi:cyanase [Nesterenkonia sandarakina]|uniref:Cyanate hydratase n=1 Tax=Nesterenkonia sandarakina TaxID=272918 RepID=A0A7Z0E944_9MICC|nr:cyanase [Nesterenkonia sandarakina]NYJ16622.1 cyanate lyase [Nesterenkonia sandarakina]